MSIAFQLIYAAYCRGTHHKLALNSLLYLQHDEQKRWRKVFLKHAEKFLAGSKAPDTQFKDFKNHVLHVSDGYWGGAPEKTYEWYNHFVTALKEKRWENAVFCAGVMGHYYTDSIQPLHTAQSEAENNIHRAFEWSVSKSYETLRALGKKQHDNIEIDILDRFDWVERLVCEGAEKARPFYEELVANYDFNKGAKRPKAGLNKRAKAILAELLMYATVGLAKLLDQAFVEAQVMPPDEDVVPEALVAASKIPTKWLKAKFSNWQEARYVMRMYVEFKRNGKVEEFLPEDDRAVRDLFYEEVLKPARKGSLAEALRNMSQYDNPPKKSTSAQAVRSANRSVPAQNSLSEKAVRYAMPEPSLRSEATDSQEKNIPKEEHKKSDKEGKNQVAVSEEQHIRNTLPPEMAEMALQAATHKYKQTPSRSITTSRKTPQRAHSKRPVKVQSEYDLPLKPAPGVGLQISDDVEKAPSIGPKTTKRLNTIGIRTISDLLQADPQQVSETLKVSYITKTLVSDWQSQARLVCTVPHLKGQDAQLLVGAGCRSAEYIASLNKQELFVRVSAFCKTTKGERILRSNPEPNMDDINNWVKNAASVTASQAA